MYWKIFITGALTTSAPEKDMQKILKITNEELIESFVSSGDGTLMFNLTDVTGNSPGQMAVVEAVNRNVMGPLTKLSALAKERGFDVSGRIEVRSDRSDSDNVTVEMRNNEPVIRYAAGLRVHI